MSRQGQHRGRYRTKGQGGKHQTPARANTRPTSHHLGAYPADRAKVSAWCYVCANRGLRPATHRWADGCPDERGDIRGDTR